MGMWSNSTAIGLRHNSNGNGFTEVPDGTYLCQVINLELGESKKGMPMLKTRFKILTGDYAGQNMFVNNVVLRSLNGSTDDDFLIDMAISYLEGFHIIDDIRYENLASIDAAADYIANEVCKPTVAFQVKKENVKGYSRYSIEQGPLTYQDASGFEQPQPQYPEYPQTVAIPEPGAPLAPQPTPEQDAAQKAAETQDDIPF